jgi:restriction endonuclease Mrr
MVSLLGTSSSVFITTLRVVATANEIYQRQDQQIAFAVVDGRQLIGSLLHIKQKSLKIYFC